MTKRHSKRATLALILSVIGIGLSIINLFVTLALWMT